MTVSDYEEEQCLSMGPIRTELVEKGYAASIPECCLRISW